MAANPRRINHRVIIYQGSRQPAPRSELLDVVEGVRLADGLPQTLSIFNVAGVVADSRVENVVKRVLAKEHVGEYAKTLPKGAIGPKIPQVGDGVDVLFLEFQLNQELLPIYAESVAHFP